MPNIGLVLIVAFVCALIYLWGKPHWFAPRGWGECDSEVNADATTPYNQEDHR